MKIPSLLAPYEKKWQAAQKSPYRNLLRRVILRQIMRDLHAEKSNTPQGKDPREERDLINRVESQLAERMSGELTDSTLESLLKKPASPNETTQAPDLDSKLLETLGREKLTRFDRKWEYQIARDAARSSWSFWHLDAWIAVFHAESFHRELAEKLWPHAVVLFVEGSPETTPQQSKEAVHLALWKGRWLIACERSPDPIDSLFTEADGLVTTLEAPRWHGLKSEG